MNLLAPIYNAVTALANRLTSGRAAALDNLDAAISTRAVASTALNNTTWSNSRAALLDNLSRLDMAVTSLKDMKFRLFTSTADWTSPSVEVNVMVIAIGAGGGGAYRNGNGDVTNGTAGGNTSFGALVTASGGSGGSTSPGTTGYAIGGHANDSYDVNFAAAPGAGFMGIGHGGQARALTSTSPIYCGCSGAVGTYFGSVNPNTTITVTVGTGGAGGGASNGASRGAHGAVLLFYW